MLNRGETLPVDFRNRFIYYVGPVDPVRDEVVGPAGPTTATRMDKFTANAGASGLLRHGRRCRHCVVSCFMYLAQSYCSAFGFADHAEEAGLLPASGG